MHTPRERHNAKARQSTAGQRKKGKRKATSIVKDPDYDPNAEIIAPKSEEQKELDRRERLRQEVCHTHTALYGSTERLSIATSSSGVQGQQQEEKETR